MCVTDPMNVKQVVAEKGQANLPRIDKLNQMNDIAVRDLVTRVGLVGFYPFQNTCFIQPPIYSKKFQWKKP